MCSRKDGQLFNILSEYYNTDFYFPTNLGRSGIKEKSKSYFFTKYQSFCSYSCTQQFCFYSSFKHHLVAYYCFQLAQHWYCSKLSGFFFAGDTAQLDCESYHLESVVLRLHQRGFPGKETGSPSTAAQHCQAQLSSTEPRPGQNSCSSCSSNYFLHNAKGTSIC